MRIAAVILSIFLLAPIGSFGANASEAETFAAINASSNELHRAFANRDVEAIKLLMTPDHVSVTPYYDGPQSVADQIASLPELDYGQTIVGKPSIVLLSPDVALRTFIADLKGSFKGKPLPTRAFVSETLVRRDGKWVERFFQTTSLRQ
jgi:ketosteroid isomerase-like protein